MSETEFIKVFLGIFLTSGGLALILIAFLAFYKYLNMEKLCTSSVKGMVKKYKYRTDGISLPVVYYNVGGREYKVVGPEFRSYVIKKVSSPFSENNMKYRIDDKYRLIVERYTNSFVSASKNPLCEMYPEGSEVFVYYNPNKPKLAYVERYCGAKKGYFWLVFLTGLAVLVMDIIILSFC